jgi:hypothetical protein
VDARGARGFARASDQPTALMPAPSDESNRGIGGWAGVPPSLVVAAGGDAVLEVAGKDGGGAFTFDDLEALASLAHIAGAAVDDHDDGVDDVPGPAELGALLQRLAQLDPTRYRSVARVIDALLTSGA